MRTSGWKCPTSSAVITSMRPNPNALYESASRLSSAKRSRLCAMATLPTCRNPVDCPVSASSSGRRVAGVGAQLRVGVAVPGGADESRRVPARAGRELPALEEDDVGPSQLRKVIGDARAGHAAPDDDRARTLRQCLVHRSSSPFAPAGRRLAGGRRVLSWPAPFISKRSSQRGLAQFRGSADRIGRGLDPTSSPPAPMASFAQSSELVESTEHGCAFAGMMCVAGGTTLGVAGA